MSAVRMASNMRRLSNVVPIVAPVASLLSTLLTTKILGRRSKVIPSKLQQDTPVPLPIRIRKKCGLVTLIGLLTYTTRPLATPSVSLHTAAAPLSFTGLDNKTKFSPRYVENSWLYRLTQKYPPAPRNLLRQTKCIISDLSPKKLFIADN